MPSDETWADQTPTDENPEGNAMPDERDEIAAVGRKVVEMLGACAAAPDDVATGRAADALRDLELLLAAGSSK
jgi:hypothetical protein